MTTYNVITTAATPQWSYSTAYINASGAATAATSAPRQTMLGDAGIEYHEECRLRVENTLVKELWEQYKVALILASGDN